MTGITGKGAYDMEQCQPSADFQRTAWRDAYEEFAVWSKPTGPFAH
jgi:hypothetical protein